MSTKKQLNMLSSLSMSSKPIRIVALWAVIPCSEMRGGFFRMLVPI
jgi:hypothetical protein